MTLLATFSASCLTSSERLSDPLYAVFSSGTYDESAFGTPASSSLGGCCCWDKTTAREIKVVGTLLGVLFGTAWTWFYNVQAITTTTATGLLLTIISWCTTGCIKVTTMWILKTTSLATKTKHTSTRDLIIQDNSNQTCRREISFSLL